MSHQEDQKYFVTVERAPEAASCYRVWFPDLPGCETRTESNELRVVKAAAKRIFDQWIEEQRQPDVRSGDPTPDPVPAPGYPTLSPWRDLLAHSGGYKVLLGHGVIYLASALPAALRGDHPA